MMRFLTTSKLASVLFFSLLVPAAFGQTLKIATIAPEGSSWMNDMKAGAKAIEAHTGGRVKFKFYGGGVQGNDKQVLRKMRIGQLHGGTFTSSSLGEFQKNAVLYAMPMLFNNLEEVQFARSRMDSKLRNLIEEAGYINFGFAGGGFAHIMSVRPIANLNDMQGLKVWVRKSSQMESGEEISVAVRPEKIQVLAGEQGGPNEIVNRFTGRIDEIVYLGEAKIYRVNLAPDVIIEAKVQSGPSAQKYNTGDKIVVGWQTRHGLALK